MNALRHVIFCLVIVSIAQIFLSADAVDEAPARSRPFAPVMVAWTDSLLGTLSADQKIDLLFIQPLTSRIDSASPIAALPPLVFARYEELVNMDNSGSILPGHQLSSISDTQALSAYFDALALWCNDRGINYLTGPSLSLFYNDLNPATRNGALDSDPEFPALVGSLFVTSMQAHGILAGFDSVPRNGQYGTCV